MHMVLVTASQAVSEASIADELKAALPITGRIRLHIEKAEGV